MCEPFILQRTGLTVAKHQQLTIRRYTRLVAENTGVYILPVLQGYEPAEYVDHIQQYANLLPWGQLVDGEWVGGPWVGVGSVCRRNSDLAAIEAVLVAIKDARPDLRLHGFGVKTTALQSSIVRDCLYSADSMAWSYAARKQGRNANDWHEAATFTTRIDHQAPTPRAYQYSML